MPDLGPSDSFLLVLVVIPALIVPVVFLVLVLAAVVRRRGGASIGRRLSAALAFAGGASLGTLLLIFGTQTFAWPLVGAAGAVAIARWWVGRRVQAGWLLLGAGLPLPLLWATAFIEYGLSGTVIDLDDGIWLGVTVTAVLVGIALVLRGDPSPGPV